MDRLATDRDAHGSHARHIHLRPLRSSAHSSANNPHRRRTPQPEAGPLMPPLARRNLFHDRVRLIVTLTGIAFSVVLMVVQWGLFQGFSTSTASIIDHSGADIWIAAKDTAYLEQAVPFNERKY